MVLVLLLLTLVLFLGPVHTYPDIFESATFSFRMRLPSTRIRRIRQRIRKKINPLSRLEKNKSATNPITCGRVNPDIFKSDDVKSVSSLSPNNKLIWRTNVSGEQQISRHYAKSFAYVNNMPWGLVNYEYKGPHWARPLHSTLGLRLE